MVTPRTPCSARELSCFADFVPLGDLGSASVLARTAGSLRTHLCARYAVRTAVRVA